jgi:hypothetical protein
MKAIPGEEIRYLRELAKKQREYAELPVMDARRKQWIAINEGNSALPPVAVETWTFDPDMMPPDILRCGHPGARKIEYSILRTLREFEEIHDDKVIPGYYPVSWKVEIDWFGIPAGRRYAQDAGGRTAGFAFDMPVQDLERDFERLQPARIRLDREGTAAELDLVNEALQGILPALAVGFPPLAELTGLAVSLTGMENLMLFLYDCPGMVHKLMAYIAENYQAVQDFYRREGLLTANSGMGNVMGSSYGFMTNLPEDPRIPVSLGEQWLWAEAEETVTVSPEMFADFFLPPLAQVCKPLGRVYYGCCEPMEKTWEMVYRAIPNTGKVSVSPYCDQRRMGELLRGSGVVFSRKPRPHYLGVDADLNEDAWRAHIAETFSAAQGGPCEVILRDIYQVRTLEAVRRAADIVREEGLRFYG